MGTLCAGDMMCISSLVWRSVVLGVHRQRGKKNPFCKHQVSGICLPMRIVLDNVSLFFVFFDGASSSLAHAITELDFFSG